jgi:hypothetical protein
MKRVLFIILLFIPLFASAQDIGGDYYVAPTGHSYPGMGTPSDSNDGSYANPWATIDHAFSTIDAGDTVYFRGGTYHPSANNEIDNSGTAANPICVFGYPGDDSVYFDGSQMDSASYVGMIYMSTKQYIHFKDLVIQDVRQFNGTLTAAISGNECANLTYERVTVRRTSSRGWWHDSGAYQSYNDILYEDSIQEPPTAPFTEDTTRWIMCDAYELCDTLTGDSNVWSELLQDSIGAKAGNGADGWKCVVYAEGVLHWRQCRVWNYSDDGYDPSAITGGQRLFDSCWAMSSAKYEALINETGIPMEGDGWKIPGVGGDSFTMQDTVTQQTVIMKHGLAIFNIGDGFREQDYNSLLRTNGLYYNNTAAWNGINYHGFEGDSAYERTTIYRNNITYEPRLINAYEQPYHLALTTIEYPESNNIWDRTAGAPNWVITDTVTLTSADLITTDSSEIVALFTAARGANGEIPSFPVKLAPTSDLIDAGTQPFASDNAGFSLPYYGTEPDIGAYQYNSGDPENPTWRYSGQSDGAPIRHNGKTVIIRQ